MSPFRLFLLTTALMMTLAACGSDDDSVSAGSGGDTDLPAVDDGDDDTDGSNAAGGDATRPWIGGEWDLQSMTLDGAAVTVPPTAAVNVSITGPDRITGNAGCNSIDGVISAPFDGDRDGGPLSIEDLSWTEMGCDILDFEGQYLEALLDTNEWELAPPSGLVFRGDGIELVYGIGAPAAEVAFENTEWLFDTIFDGEGVERTASSTRADKPQVTAVISAGQAELTSEDCGTITLGAGYEAATDGPITFEGTEAAFAACEDPESNMLSAIQGLADASSFQVFDGRLTFIGFAGETISFIAADG